MRIRVLLAVAAVALLAGCSTVPAARPDTAASPSQGGPGTAPTRAPTVADPAPPPQPVTTAPTPTGAASTGTAPSAEPGTTAVAGLSDADLAGLGVNEIGRVLVVEWHVIGDTDARWATSLSTFRAQLQELHDRGYRPVSVPEFVAGTFPIPAGTSPVLLTFDDSDRSHLWFDADGTPGDDSVVGVLESMEAADPTWRARASFAFYWPTPFREAHDDLVARKLRYLVDHGYDLSNHTYGHDNLAELSDDQVVENLASAEAELARVVGGDYRVRSITLTQGIWPTNRGLAIAGTWNGFTYDHDIALEVGFMPTRSPHHAEYDPRSVQRVQAYVPEFRTWVDWLDATPGRRFVSDGDPTTVTYPASFADVAAVAASTPVRVYPDAATAPAPATP